MVENMNRPQRSETSVWKWHLLPVLIFTMLVTTISLSGCGNRSSSPRIKTGDYVGIWVNYKSRLQDDSWRWYTEDVDPMMYFVIYEDGTAEIVNTSTAGEPSTTKCRWHQAEPGKGNSTWEEQGYGTENDIVVLTGDSEYALTYRHTDEKPTTKAEPLVNFNLVIDPFEHYLEKVSNDPNETPWAFTSAKEEGAEDYVGIWLNYKVQEDDGNWHELKIGQDQVIYAVINENATAKLIEVSRDSSPLVKEFRWRTIEGNDELGTYYGIRLSNSDDGCVQLIQDLTIEKPDFIANRLAEFSLLNGPSVASCFEKISNNTDDAPWVADYGIQLDEIATETMVPDGAINWTEASSHIGEYVTIYGSVKDSSYLTSSNGQPSYVDIGAAYPDDRRLTMVIWGEDRANFSGEPDQMYLGKTVCVTGELYEYEGVAYVKVSTPEQIKVVD